MKLPVGIQTFAEIREEGYLYIDKTEQINNILTKGKYFFLSRPRRFGKSLLLSTIRSLYECRKDLFEGLWIADKWNWEEKYPVIHVQFASQGIRTLGLEKAITTMFKYLGKQELDISLENESYDTQFKELIFKAAQNSPTGKAVILIDEYDKPIIDYLDDLPKAKENRQILKNFYSILKDSDPYIELVFITGVSRFAKTSIFSDLNNIMNLTIHPLSLDLLGITQEEVEKHFSDRIEKIAEKSSLRPEALKQEIKHWYNGYSWDGETKVYNPFSLLSYFLTGKFRNFWFETGTPTFLVNAMRERKMYKIEKIRASDATLDGYDIESLNTTTILFQAGYLTINKEVRLGVYELVYPNNEVRISLQEYLLNTYRYDPLQTGKIKALDIAEAFESGEIEQVIETINYLFATIPSNLWQKDNEAFYHALIHLTFSLVGVFVQSEINSSNGRLDAMVETSETIYILEFKLDKTAEEALQQIRDKNYFQAYANREKQRVGIGINFSKKDKKVDGFEVVNFSR